ncbi:2-phospho-L-lactate guanylyltransferase [Egicoccus sp. AB-alg2]|uniref:2-phospho-L-lactate guanylyltransferase n=1 Tax=Egicoccus sp. AB-alg2 TaxID=3242693 RepID=UPI00359D36C5
MSPSTVALVPLRAPGAGKTRLSVALSAEQRGALAGAMLADVCRALSEAPVDDLVVVAGGEAAAAAASALGLEVLLDAPGVTGLDAAIRAAQHRLGPVPALLVVTADLPRLQADDVATLLDQDAEVVVAPTDDGGTGGLLRRPGDAIDTAYGPNSARRHAAEARRRGRSLATVHTAGFATDVDTLADLTALSTGPVGATTAALLATWSDRDADAG